MQIVKSALWSAMTASAMMCLCAPGIAHADSTYGIQLAGGTADHHGEEIGKVDLGLVWDPHLTWWAVGGWNFGLLGEAHAAYWNTDGNVNKRVGEFGATPVFRFEKSAGPIRPFFEAGVGVRVLTHARFTDAYTLSSAFQFADMLGVGFTFGERQQYTLGYRFQHLSNASIKRPNPGIDFNQIYVTYMFK